MLQIKKNMIKNYFLLFCLMISFLGFGQNRKIDSLTKASYKAKIDKLLFEELPKIKPTETNLIQQLYDDALSLTNENLTNYIVFIYTGKAQNYERIGDEKNALIYMNKSYEAATRYKDFAGSARALQLKGIYYGKRNKLDSSAFYINKSIKIIAKNIYNPAVDSTKNKNLLLNLKSNLALNYLLQKKHKFSLDLSTETFELAKKFKNKKTELLSVGYIAGNFMGLGQYKKAIEYYKKELDGAIAIKNPSAEAFATLHIGQCEESLNDFRNAKLNFNKALSIFELNKNADGILKTKHAIFTHYRKLNYYQKCHELENELLSLYTESKNDLSQLYIELSEIYTLEKRFVTASEYLDKAEKLLKSNGNSKKLFFNKKALLEKEQGNTEKSLEYKQKEVEITRTELDSIFTNKLAFYETKYKTAEKTAQIELQNALLTKRKFQIKTQQLELQKEKTNKYLAFGGIGILMLLGSGGFLWFRNQQKQTVLKTQNTLLGLQQDLVAAELANLNKQLDPHEIKNLLASISPEIQEKAPESYKKMLKLFNLTKASLNSSSITDSVENQLQQIDDFLSLEKNMLSVPLRYFIENSVETNKEIPRFLLKNLVENSLKHGIKKSETGGEINIKLSNDNDSIFIEIDDTGIGRKHAISLDSGIGTTTYQKLFATLNPKNKDKATFEIIDKQIGTKVEVKIPTNYKYS